MGEVRLVPTTIKRASRFVAEHHRHNGPPQGALFAVAAEAGGELVGVAIVGRPVARRLDDGQTAEVTRLCTTGEANACSLLYGAAARAAKALGYRRIVTYTLADEPGTSLRAAGWERDASVKAEGSWSRPSRARTQGDRPAGAKVRWVKRWGVAGCAALLALLLLSSPALAGHLTELNGERAVAFAGRTWTWEQLADKRAEDPRAFDAILPKVGWMLADPGRAMARRDLDPARFDRYHPCLGWLLAGRERPGGVVPEPPVPPVVVPPVVVRPAAVPEPGSAFLAGAGVGLVLAYLIARRRTR